MAQLLSPVCTNTLKFLYPVQGFCSRNKLPMLGVNWSSHGRGRKNLSRVRVASQYSESYEEIADDYYSVLGLLPDASPDQIKKAYYNCMKACHPDLSGNNPETTNFCMFINEVYTVLSDPVQRMIYDEIHGYALTAINPFLDDSIPKDHVFVDEFSCIGCKNCANVCPKVFAIEEDFGRARVYSQSGYLESVQDAVDSWCCDISQIICLLLSTTISRHIFPSPVDCIHWTSASQLSLLEDEMRRVERVNVALMLSGMGSASMDVFRLASSRWEKRQSKVLRQAKVRMMRQKGSDKTQTYWSNLWGNAKDYENTEEEKGERAQRAAAAARRWREYSRRGADKPPTYKLPEAVSNNDQ